MITSQKAKEKVSGGFVVADIETEPDGTVIDIDVCWREFQPGLFGQSVGEIVHKHYHDWTAFWEFLTGKARRDKRFRRVFAHNGGGFDWVCLAEWFLTAGAERVESVSTVQAGSRMIVLRATVEKRFTINFADSLPILRGSLDDLAWKFLGKRKIDLGERLPHEVKAIDPALYDEYCKQDTELLLQILEKVLDIITSKVAPIGDLGFTIGATSMKVFRAMLEPEHSILIPTDAKLKDILRRGFTGGRVELFKRGEFANVNVYDINSLYPAVMARTPVPTTDRGYWVGPEHTIKPGEIGVYEIEFKQNPATGAAVLTQKGKGIYSGSGVWFTPELILLKEIDPDCPITIKQGFVFLDKAVLFGPFVERLYSLRLTDKKGPLGEITKYLLNANYGKWGQKSERTKLVVCRSTAEICRHIRAEYAAFVAVNKTGQRMIGEKGYTPINHELGVFEVSDDIKCEHEHVGIAGTITSAARVALYRGIQLAGFESVVYCDTDSVHCTSSLPNDAISDARLGAFKHEFSGAAVYCGKKLYALRGADSAGNPIEKVRAKGVSVRYRANGKTINRNGFPLDYASMQRIAAGQSIECTFKQPATHLEVFSGRAKAGVFKERKRTIRCT